MQAKKKILILTASPLRDSHVDGLIKEELERLGNTVWVHPCLREGRDAVLRYKPNVVILPPIRNPYSRDLAETCKDWGIGIVSRHTEASCDWQDFKSGDENAKSGILGRWRYAIDKELVWGEDEAQILEKRKAGFPTIAVGSFSADKYLDPEITAKYKSRDVFYPENQLDIQKKTILILSAWGFVDSAPDLNIDELPLCSADARGRDLWLEMIVSVKKKLHGKYNILVSLHPNVDPVPYREALSQCRIPLNITSTAVELVYNCDIVIHSGSTTAIGAHLMNKPAFQYSDLNSEIKSWFSDPKSAMSKVSPKASTVDELITWVDGCKCGSSNANKGSIRNLVNGRFGKMDGKAFKRAAKEIDEVTGKCKFCWPRAHVDYDQLTSFKEESKAVQDGACGICKKTFTTIRSQYLVDLCNALGGDKSRLGNLTKHSFCPHCAARFYKK